jgi:hypothetical protein
MSDLIERLQKWAKIYPGIEELLEAVTEIERLTAALIKAKRQIEVIRATPMDTAWIYHALGQEEKVGPPKDWTPDRSWQGGHGDKE